MLDRIRHHISSVGIEWVCIKLPFIIANYYWIKRSLFNTTSISVNKGICSLVSCDVLIIDTVKWLVLGLMVIASILYLFERKMIVVTFTLFVISLFVFSAHESYGVQERTGIVTLIWLVQFVAYLWKWRIKEFDLEKNRIFFPVQVIVVSYTLSALSKIQMSGWSWFHDSHMIILQMLKTNQVKYLDGQIQLNEIVDSKIEFVMQHGTIMSLLLLSALLIELTSGIGLLSKKLRLLYGLLLLFFHFGIDFFFGIVIDTFFESMIIFMINPYYLGYLIFTGKRKEDV